MKALYRVDTGKIICPLVVADYSKRESLKIKSGEWAEFEYGEVDKNNVMLRRAIVTSGALVLLDKSEWPENQELVPDLPEDI